MAYRYIAYNRNGERIQGVIDAVTERAAEELLWSLDYTIVSLKEIQNRSSLAQIMPSFFGVKTREIIIFSRQMATLIDSGIPIIRSLQLLSEQTSHRYFRRIISQIANDIRAGKSFSEALTKHKSVFPEIYARMIEVGERTGNLEMVLRQMALYLEKSEAIGRKIKGAMAYPTLVLMLAIGVVILLFTVALPPMMGLFESFEVELPLPTRILLALTRFGSQYRVPIFIGLIATLIIIVWFLSTPTGKRMKDQLLLRLPLLKKITIEGGAARLSRTMSTLLRAGLSLPEIMELTMRTQSNTIIREALANVRDELLQGQGLSEPMRKHKVFPSMLIQMIRVGEESGTLDSNLETLANFYEEEVDRAIAAMTSAIEPALTIFVGAIVGFVAVATIMPMYSIIGAIGG